MSPMSAPEAELTRLVRRTRTLPPTNISAEFILSSVSLAENSQYLPEHNRFVSLSEAKLHEDAMLELWKGASTEKEKLLHAMELLRQKTSSKGSSNSELKAPPATWKQVLAEVHTASEAYSKTIFARMCDKSEVFEHWLNLLPNGDYSSTISGAFIMGVQAARGLSTIQKNIYEALASIPDTLSHASAYVEIYRAHSSDALVQKTANMCKCIFITLRLIVEFFLKSSFRRGAGAVLKGSSYQQALTESILEMKSQALSLREEANVCLQRRIAEMDRKNDLRTFKEQFRHKLAKEELLLAIDSSAEITAQKVCTYLMRQLQSNPEFSVRTGGALLAPDQASSTLDNSDRSPSPEYSDEGITSNALLELLEFDSELQRDDITFCLTLGFTQTPRFQDQAAWVLRSPEIGKFIAGKARSKLLVINGNFDAIEFLSPLSYVCAKIADMISVVSEVMLLTHFCSRHTDEWREPRANSSGLINSLVGQLLSQIKQRRHSGFRLNLTSMTEKDLGAIHGGNTATLYDLFWALVQQLPKGTVVFCLIDSLSVYENADRKEDTMELMRKLARIVKKAKSVVFKCMVTYPGRSCYLESWGVDFEGKVGSVLEVPEQI